MPSIYQRSPKILNKALLINVFPLILSSVANRIAGIVDSILAGHMLDANALSAIKLVISVPDQFITSLIVLLGVGVSTTVMTYKAKREDEKANTVFTVSILLSLIISGIVTFGLLIFANPIINFFTEDRSFVDLTLDYYYPFVLFIPIEIVISVVTYCIYLDKAPRFLIALTVVNNVLNLLFDIVFAGFFDWGIVGFSVASGIGKLSNVFMLIAYYWYGNRSVKVDWSVFKKIAFAGRATFETLQSGFSAAIAPLLILIRMSYIEKLVLMMTGTVGMAIFTVFDNCENLVYMFVSGLSQMMLLMCSMLIGENDSEGVKIIIRRAFTYMSILCLGLIAVVMIFPSFFFKMYGMYALVDNEKALTILRITAISFLGTGLSLLMRRFFTGVKQDLVSTILSVISSLMLIPVAFIFTQFFAENGIWFAIMLECYLIFLPLLPYLKYKRVKENLANLLLIPKNVTDELFFISYQGTEESLQSVPQFVKETVLTKDINDAVGEKLRLIVDAMMKHIIHLNQGKLINFDLRLRNTEEGLKLAIKDDGDSLNLILDENQCTFMPGVDVAHTLIKRISHTRVIGLNQTVIMVNA